MELDLSLDLSNSTFLFVSGTDNSQQCLRQMKQPVPEPFDLNTLHTVNENGVLICSASITH